MRPANLIRIDCNGVRKRICTHQTVQSFTSLYDQDESTGAFVVYPGSHKLHEEAVAATLKARSQASLPDLGNFVSLSPLAVARLLATADSNGGGDGDGGGGSSGAVYGGALQRPRLVRLKAGDALFWDSRVAHMSHPPPTDKVKSSGSSAASSSSEVESEVESWEPSRAVVYACMAPAHWAPEEALRRRARAFHYSEPCTHWPSDPSNCLSEGSGLPLAQADLRRRMAALPDAPPPFLDGAALALVAGEPPLGEAEAGGGVLGNNQQPAPPRCDLEMCYGERLY